MTTAVEISMDGKLQPLTVIVESMRRAWERNNLPKENLEKLIEQFLAGDLSDQPHEALQKRFFNATLALINWEKIAVEFAEKAAPYLHNKLQSVDHNMAMAVLHSIDSDDASTLLEKLAAKRQRLSDPKAAAQVAKLLDFKPKEAEV